MQDGDSDSRVSALDRIEQSPALQQRRTTPDLVADLLREAILTGRMPDGEPLNSVELARHFGVSRPPIREALRRLESEGLVRQEAHRRAVVQGLTNERLMELFDLRIRLECYLLERAFEALGTSELEALTELCDRMDAESDHDTWLGLNREFHDVLYAPSGAEYALELSEQIRRRTTRYVYIAGDAAAGHRLRPANEEHRDILELLKAGDLSAALDTLATHIDSTRSLVGERMSLPEADTSAGR